jgi:NADH-quinone oxidoreductase subunit N
MNFIDLLAILPLIILVGWTIILILVDLFVPAQRKGLIALLAAIGIVIALAFAISQFGEQTTAFRGMVVVDGLAYSCRYYSWSVAYWELPWLMIILNARALNAASIIFCYYFR